MRIIQIVLSICVVHVIYGASLRNNIMHNDLARINSDQEASSEQFPFIASIRRFGKHLCAGSIITTQYILTHAFCTDDDLVDGPESVQAVVGTISIHDGGVVYDIREFRPHPKYETITEDTKIGMFQYFVSMLITKEEIQFTAQIKPIPLPQNELPSNGDTKVEVAAWGRNSVVKKLLKFSTYLK